MGSLLWLMPTETLVPHEKEARKEQRRLCHLAREEMEIEHSKRPQQNNSSKDTP